MKVIFVCCTVLLAAPAWAVGERISVSGDAVLAGQFKDTVCISMECGRQSLDGAVTVRRGKAQAEIEVQGFNGVHKTTVNVPLNAEGKISGSELMAATAEVVKAIETPVSAYAKAQKAAPAAKKLAAAKKKSGVKGVRVALRLAQRG